MDVLESTMKEEFGVVKGSWNRFTLGGPPAPTIRRTFQQIAAIRHHEWRAFGIVHPNLTIVAENVNGTDVFTWCGALCIAGVGDGHVVVVLGGEGK